MHVRGDSSPVTEAVETGPRMALEGVIFKILLPFAVGESSFQSLMPFQPLIPPNRLLVLSRTQCMKTVVPINITW